VATVQDVARRAGVSTATVSYALNGTRFVSDALRERVLSAARELQYEPNAAARTLRSNRSATIGLLIADLRNPFFTEVLRGVEDTAQARGYTVILANSDEDIVRETASLRVLRARHVDGLILAPAAGRHPQLEQLVRSHFPMVFLDRDIPGLRVPAVMLDNKAAAHVAVRHLIAAGHRHIGMIAGRPSITSTIERQAGYRQALLEAGIPMDSSLVKTGGSSIDGGAAAAAELLERRPRPTALFVANNLMTVGALTVIERHGLRIPQDVALVGFDDFPWAEVLKPRLTTIAQPHYALGCRAAELLFEQLSGFTAQPRRVLLPGELILRDSSSTDGVSQGSVDASLEDALPSGGPPPRRGSSRRSPSRTRGA
jgi:LacI family transcriptional regulator